MKTKLTNLNVEDVKVKESIYPRMYVDFVTGARYYNALRSGATFPPIAVAVLNEEYVLIDGAHRLKAFQQCKKKTIPTEILTDLKTEQEMYVEAVKRNIGHGRQFSTQEVTQIAMTLQEWNLTDEAIAEIIRIPATEISPFILKRMTRITETNEDISLKSPLKHLAGTPLSDVINQKGLPGTSQVVLIDTLIALVKNNWIDIDSELVMEKIAKLYKLLTTLNNPTIV